MSLITARNISLGYHNNGHLHTVLSDFNFTLQAGELVGLLGPSGVGKSTLLRVLAGLATPLQGEVRWFGEVIVQPHPQLGFVFQQPALLPWLNVMQNVAFGLDFGHAPKLSKAERQHRVEKALQEVGLADAARRYPNELSGGMAQRVALARTLAKRPAVWLLDEPFSALDAVTRTEMQQLLRHIISKHNASAVMVTHDIDEALLIADRAILIGNRPGKQIGEWALFQPFPRDDYLAEMNSLRLDILTTLRQAHLAQTQAATADFVI